MDAQWTLDTDRHLFSGNFRIYKSIKGEPPQVADFSNGPFGKSREVLICFGVLLPITRRLSKCVKNINQVLQIYTPKKLYMF